MKTKILVFLAILSLFPYPLPAQQPNNQEKKEEKPADEGIPITSELVQKSCSPCHKIDEKKRMSRISYRRTTPEGWQQTIKRMVSLNKVQLEPADARAILKYLSNNLGLAPEEARPGAFEVEKRMIDYKYSDSDTEKVCNKCHSMGRVILQRRTKEEWELLVSMHRGYYPLSDFQAFRRMGPPQTEPGPDGRPPDNRHPMEKAVAHLAGAFPLKTDAWSAWSANMRPPRLQGTWALSGYQLGKGPVYGQVHITPVARNEDELLTEATYTYARSGKVVTRSGKALIYTGFQWRGRSSEAPGENHSFREVMFVERDLSSISGRWFEGAYDEIGLDINLRRTGKDPLLLGVDRNSARTGSTGLSLKVFGANLPASLSTADIDFGRGIRVTGVTGTTPDSAVVQLDVAADASIGARDLFVSGAVLPGAVVVYDKVDGIKVLPVAGLARVGGIQFPKQFQQFEALAFHDGADGKPDTKDDLNLGAVDVSWSMEEFSAVFGDDDKDFVGTLNATGLFTPNVDGPNPKRKNRTNNYGDVWIIATYQPLGADKAAKPIRARAHLVVTIPIYLKFDQPEVAQ
jgi:quinohemoprotein amine dehydrogenase